MHIADYTDMIEHVLAGFNSPVPPFDHVVQCNISIDKLYSPFYQPSLQIFSIMVSVSTGFDSLSRDIELELDHRHHTCICSQTSSEYK